MTHTQTVMLRLLTMCIPFRNLRKKGRAFLRDFLSDYDRNARRSMRAWRRHAVAGRTILILEPNYCHGEVLPGFCRHLLDMGYRVDVLMHHSLARQSPLCCFKEGDIHIFTAMCTSWKRLAKARVLTRYEAILVSTSAFYDIPGWASFLHMTGLDKFANLLAVEHELKDIPRFGEEELDRQGRLLTLGSFPRGMMVNPHFFGEIPPAPRNREPVFITVGSLSAQRKNHELLVEALETVYHEGHRDFSVIIVGEGELGEIPGHLRPFLHVAGKLDFPAMYEAMRRAISCLSLIPAIRRTTATLPPASPAPPCSFTDSRRFRSSMKNSLPSTASMTGTHFFTGKKRLAAPCSAPSGKRRRNTRKCSRRFSNWAGILTGNPAPT